MAKAVMIEQFHVSVFVPAELPPATVDAIRQALDGRRFRVRLRRTVEAMFGRDPALTPTQVTVSR